MKEYAKKSIKTATYLLWALGLVFLVGCGGEQKNDATQETALDLSPDNAGLTLPDGFGALKVADSLGKPRHIAVTAQGGIYVKLENAVDGKGILYLEDDDGNGTAEVKQGFGDYGGTGILLDKSGLYASSNSEVFRYKVDADGKVVDPASVDTLITGLIDRRQHNSKSIALDNSGNIYVNIGAYSNSCQKEDRALGSMGMKPCPILDSAGGIWQFRTDAIKQSYGEGKRFATGLRNVVGLDWNERDNHLFVMQHGRDQLHTLFPDIYDIETSANLPAETMYRLEEGSDAGWPYIYYDQNQNKKIMAPEYGGDGKKLGAEDIQDPIVAFPGHLAPNALLFYTGDMFPEKYRNGAFIAFHGSWNRAPEEQEGYNVAFVPFENGRPSGDYEIFADGFAGTDSIMSPDEAQHRPTGLAQGPDGSLYVSDDQGGTLFRIVYTDEAEQ
ncbi:Glucose/arabinose dehydrogenase, beta-propeller fold [Pricia antarctica]|uniref:Glucose/arabinose dehydrogenase, beta-propeller fold n=1 Tax=Pricia antarctica TaxID=641691 RepID=A0A1G6YC39_9FLAO|nr:PQQ-dependent sugar dehydrogenase [Pricia antarctica]SDD88044.1 Glucose/arabinose dehydrogenase, beta-propeller fold [Pricia antarctica]